jgi:hypothetical protein
LLKEVNVSSILWNIRLGNGEPLSTAMACLFIFLLVLRAFCFIIGIVETKQLDWMAYEIEPSDMFTHGFPGLRPPKERKPDTRFAHIPHSTGSSQLKRRDNPQEPLNEVDCLVQNSDFEEIEGGWLYTYRVTRSLRFLSIDILSGDKADMGLFDLQDFLLRGVGWGRNHSYAESLDHLGGSEEGPSNPPRPGRPLSHLFYIW